MVIFKYNIIKDIKNALWTIKDYKWFKEHNDIVVFWPNPLRWVWLLIWIVFTKKPRVESKDNIACYWVSSGTWGAYNTKDMSVNICPWKMKQCPDSLEDLIAHEILHLEHPEANDLPHNEKEKYIENLAEK